MKEDVLARRYSKAVFELAVESGSVDAVIADFKTLEELLNKLPQIGNILSNISTDGSKRKEVAEEIAATLGLGDIAKNTFKLLALNARVDILKLIINELKLKFAEYEKLLIAKITAADASHSDEMCKKISELVGRILNSKVKCSSRVEPDILGGFILDIGDLRYDASIDGKMTRLKEQLMR